MRQTTPKKVACMLENPLLHTSLLHGVHCKPALGALDDTVPSGQVLIFNKDPNDEDMQKWKDTMESELERYLDHPFIHAPELSASLEVTGIPTMFFVNSDGNIKHTMVGIKDQSTVELYWNDLS